MTSLGMLRSLFFSGLFFMLLGCTAPFAPPADFAEKNFQTHWKAEYSRMKSEIVEAREIWKHNNIRSYSFVVAKYMGGNSSPWNRSPVSINVEDQRPVSVEVVDKNDVSMLARTDGFEEFDTIDKLFDYMLKELENGRMIHVSYEERLSYPKLVTIEFSTQIHGQRSIDISKLTRADG